LKPDSPRHRPNRFGKYEQIHRAYLDSFIAEEFVGFHTLAFIDDNPYEISLKGEIACLGHLLITVDKTLEILQGSGENALVQTIVYDYNVSVRGYGNVFRYDNCHSRTGHPDNHHKHEFDWKLNEQGEGKVVWIGAEKWLTLDQVIAEAKDWYWANKDDLPEGYPELGLR
jgi:hypothetical protein